MGLFLPQRTTRQPQGPARVDRSNPLARGLKFAFIPGSAVDATGNCPRISGPQAVATPFGKTTPRLNGATPFPVYDGIRIPATGGFTIFFVGYLDIINFAAREPLISAGNWKLHNREGNLGFTIYGVADYDLTCPMPASGVVSATIVPGGTAKFYVGGALKSSTGISSVSTGLMPISIGTRAGGSDNVADSQAALVLYFDRTLSDAEHAAISANPWQLFQGQQRRLLVDAPAAAVTSALAWNEAGDTATVSATATNRAALAWIEGADTAALVAQLTNTAALAWTEDGESSVLDVQPINRASLAWTEASDTAALAAAVRNVAALAWTEADENQSIQVLLRYAISILWTEGGDSYSITATAATPVVETIQAAIAWTEGADGYAMAAAVRNSATISWTEQGDTAALTARATNRFALAWTEQGDLYALAVQVHSAAEVIALENIALNRIVVFEGSRRVVTFPGNKRVVKYPGSKRIVRF